MGFGGVGGGLGGFWGVWGGGLGQFSGGFGGFRGGGGGGGLGSKRLGTRGAWDSPHRLRARGLLGFCLPGKAQRFRRARSARPYSATPKAPKKGSGFRVEGLGFRV